MYKTIKCAYLQIKFNILVGRYIHLELTDLIKIIIGHYLMHLQGAIRKFRDTCSFVKEVFIVPTYTHQWVQSSHPIQGKRRKCCLKIYFDDFANQ